MRPYAKELVLGPAFKLVEAILELIVPLIVAGIIDTGIRDGDAAYVTRMGGVMLLLAAVGFCSTLVCQYFAARASQGFGTNLRAKTFSHINGLSRADIERFGESSLTTRVTNDIYKLQVGVAMFIRLAIRAPFLIIGAVIMSMTIDMQMSLIFIVTAAGIALALYLVMTRTAPFYTTIQKLLDRVSRRTSENLRGARVIRAFSRQDNEKQKFRNQSDEVLAAQKRLSVLSALLNPLTYIIVNIGIIAILWFGGSAVSGGALEQGQVVALINYMTQIMIALVVVANLIVIFTRAGASATRVADVLETQPSIRDNDTAAVAPDVSAPVIRFDNVSFSYGGTGDNVLEGIDLEIGRGMTVGVIGPTGAGKSTLISMIPRLYDATGGTIYIAGIPIRDYPLHQLRAMIGVVPQNARLFGGTIRDNMLVGRGDATDGQIRRALDAAQAGFVFDRPEGLDATVGTDGQGLSGGQRQRLTIARALVRQPQILLLDDSSSALDFLTDLHLRQALHDFAPMTVVTVSQRTGAIKGSDLIIVMDDGRISGAGTHTQLLKSSGLYREIHFSQVDEEDAI
mgnify:CR=1 FL=1